MKLAAEQSKSAQIAAIIRQEIQGGRLRPGEKLEPARTLAGHLDVGRQVIRSAIRILERESLVRTAPGSGVFVRDYLPTSAGQRRIRIGFVNWHDSLAENFPLRAYLELLRQGETKNCEIFLNNSQTEQELLQWFRNYNLDGLILCGRIDDRLLHALNKAHVLFLILGNYALSEPANCLEKDVFRSVKTAVSLLLKRYHFKRIACIFGNMFGLGPRQTLEALKAAAAENGLVFDNTLFLQSESGDGYACMEYLFREKRLDACDMVYLTPTTFHGAARSIFERSAASRNRPYLFLDMPVSDVPYPDLVGCFLYESNALAEQALDAFLDLYCGRVRCPWTGCVQCRTAIS